MEENKMGEEKLNVGLEPPVEKKTSIQRLLLTIVLIVVVILGLYYTYEYYVKEPTKDGTNTTGKVDNGWNGIYKKEGSINELLLHSNNSTKGSLILEQNIEILDVIKPMYPMQYEEALTLKDGKMLYVEDGKTVFTIEKTGDKVTVTYNGEIANEDNYKELVGTYNKTKSITKFDIKEFE